jgi:signal transduction histidine kinase
MVAMMLTIIFFVQRFQKKLAARNKAYLEIEKLVNQQELRSAYSLLEGQEIERKRIAAELHDNIGGLVATLKIYSDLTLVPTDRSEIDRLNDKINKLSENLGQEVRKLSHELDLSTLSGFGLKVAVEHLAEAITESGKLHVIAVINLSTAIDDQVSLNLYRIVQELLTNTMKHAHAKTSRIEITGVDNEYTLIYEDDGSGFDQQSTAVHGIGLKNIKARCESIRSNLTIDTSPRGSTFIIENNGD